MSSERRYLRDFVTLQRGTTYKGDLVGLPGPVLLGLASILPNGGFRHGGFKTYGGECPEKIVLKSGDVYVSLKDVTQSGDLLGSVSRVPPDINSGRLTQDTVKLVFDRAPISREFVYWVLRTPSYREYCRGCATGTTTLGLARDDFLNFPITDPSDANLSLVGLLEGLETRITLLSETNATLEAIAQALFKSWFVDFDPVHAKQEGRAPEGMDEATAALFPDGFEESKLGSVPHGWSIEEIGNMAERVGMGPFGSNIKVSSFVDSGVPVLSGRNVQETLLEERDFKFVTEEHAHRLTGSCVVEGDIVITHRGTLGQVSLIAGEGEYRKYVTSQSQFFLRCDRNRIDPEWMTYFLRSINGQHLLLANVSQVGVPSIARPVSNLKTIRLLVPPRPLIKRFSEIVRELHIGIVVNRNRSKTLSTLRDTLLPRLISGQLRLSEAAAVIAEAVI